MKNTFASAPLSVRAGIGAVTALAFAGLLMVGCTAVDRNAGNPPPINISQLGLNPTSVDFQFSPGNALPTPKAIVLTGTPTDVSGLVVGTILYSPISSGWLAADLATAFDQTPNTLILTPRPPADLVPGTYVASVPIGSTVTGVNTQYVIATLTVDSVAVIDESPSAVNITVQQGGANPAPQFVSIDNAGSGTLTGLAAGPIIYDTAATGWLSISLNQTTAPATLTVQATTGALAIGTYVAQVPITSTQVGVVPDTITVTLGVSTVASPPTIAVSPAVRTVSAVAGGANPSPQNIGVSNSGGGTLGGLSIGTTVYGAGASGWLTSTIGTATAPALVTTQANINALSSGSYTATVTVQSSQAGVASATFQVVLTVSLAAVPPKVNLAPANLSYNAVAGGASPSPIQVAVTNGGGGTLGGLSLGTVTYGPGAAGWFSSGLSNTTAPATITATATLGSIAAGTYTAQQIVSSSVAGAVPDTMIVTLVVAATPVPPTIGLSPTSFTLTATAGGASPAARTVQVTNSGGQTLTGLGTGTISYTGGSPGWLAASFNQTTAPATLTLTPTTGALAAGSYSATVPVTSGVAGNSPQNVTVSLVVSGVPSITLTPTTVTFTSTTGQPDPTPKTINVANGGAGTLAGLSAGPVTYGAGQPTGWLATSITSTTSPATVVLTPTTGALAAGSYTATVPVASTTSGVASKTVTVSFLVGAPAGSMVILQGNNQSGLVNSTLPIQLKARIYDGAGNPTVGATVVWLVNNGGTLLNQVNTTNSLGEISATWKVGPLAGIHTVVVSAAGLPSVTFTADVLLPSNPASHPNEPAGYVAFAEHNFSSLPTTSSTSLGAILGKWSASTTGNLSIITPDLTAPESQPNILETRFPNGLSAGRGPVTMSGWDVLGKGPAGQKSKVYITFWLKIKGLDYENQTFGTKMGFLASALPTSGAGTQAYFLLGGNGSQVPRSNFIVNLHQETGFQSAGGFTRVLSQNVNQQALMRTNVWHQWEAVFELNTLGVANGKFKWWIDGILVCDYTDVTYIFGSNTNGFWEWKWNPTWGGTAGTKTRDDFIDIDHTYISGVP
ncbi:MAG: hypothetical protein SGJ01_19240 [Gemmatimonadota bacterium]|nr:hypothetical protein [Gemmatimonadota bacterium]